MTAVRQAPAATGTDLSTDPWERALSVTPLVRRIARRMSRTADEVEDLVSVGYLGAHEAARRWDTDSGVAFAAFASFRIKGKIRDYFRDQDTSSRADRARGRFWSTASLDGLLEAASETGDRRGLAALTDQTPDPRIRVDNLDALVRAWPVLRPKEQWLIAEYFWRGRRLRDIGDELGVTEGRISQQITVAVRRLAVELSRDEPVRIPQPRREGA